MTKIKVGDKSPFLFKDEKYKEKKIILYFYPKDNTSGCTAEACNLRDNFSELRKMGFEIIGVSPDSLKSHEKFAEKYELPFELISDENKELLQKFDAWGEKKMYGKSYMGVLRKTFVISEDGKIEHIIEKVNTKEHAKQIFELYK